MTDKKEPSSKTRRAALERSEELIGTINEAVCDINKGAKEIGFRARTSVSVKLYSTELGSSVGVMVAGGNHEPHIGLLEGGVRAMLATLNDNNALEDLALVAQLDMSGTLDDFILLHDRLHAIYTVMRAIKDDPKMKAIMEKFKGEMPQNIKDIIDEALERASEGSKQ